MKKRLHGLTKGLSGVAGAQIALPRTLLSHAVFGV